MRLVSERELIVQRMCLRRLQDSGTKVGALNSEHPQNILISYIGNKGLKKLSNLPCQMRPQPKTRPHCALKSENSSDIPRQW